MKKSRFLFLVSGLLMIISVAFAARADCLLPGVDGGVTLLPTVSETEVRYFLPAFANGQIILDGTALTLAELPYDEEQEGYRYQPADDTTPILLMRGSLPALFLDSDDPEHFGRAWVEDSELHKNEATGNMRLYDASGGLLCEEGFSRLRGRGNSTWGVRRKKAPYQFKLRHKQNLLAPEDSTQAAKNWVLLADYFEATLMNNRIGLAIGRAIGLTETPDCISVDLYYDGEYRGVYVLCEKIEVGPGRVQLTKTENPTRGEEAPREGETEAGLRIRYDASSSNAADPADVGYLLCMEHYLKDDDYGFELSNGSCFSIRSPENPTEAQARFICNRMETLWQAVSGQASLDALADVDSLAAAVLWQAVAFNADSFVFASTYWVYDPATALIRSGPLWDFDQVFRYLRDTTNAGGFGLHSYDRDCWFAALIAVPELQQAMRSIWDSTLRSLLTEDLLADGPHSYDRLAEQTELSRRMNIKLFGYYHVFAFYDGANIEQKLALTKSFIVDRVRFADVFLGQLYQSRLSDIALNATAQYIHTKDSFSLTVQPCFDAKAEEVTLTRLSFADSERYALWQCDAVLRPQNGCTFEDTLTVYVNGSVVSAVRNEDGSFAIRFRFYDITYKTLYYNDSDLGMLVNLDWLRLNEPELSARFPKDEDLLDYYWYEGLPNGLQANAFYNPRRVRLMITGNSPEDYEYDALCFLDYGQEVWDLNPVMEDYGKTIYAVPIA